MSTEIPASQAKTGPVLLDRRGFVYQPTVGPKLKVVLAIIFFLFAVLGANSVYLVSLKVLNWVTGKEHADWFYLYMFLMHLVLGLILIVPFVVFIAAHLRIALGRPNRKAVRLGLGLMMSGIVVLATGVVMVFQRQLFATESITGQTVYWLHVLSPLAVMAFYVLHRLAGPRIQWRYAKLWAGGVVVLVLGFGYMHFQDPRQWGVEGAGEDYFFPSSARTLGGQGGTPFIPARALTNDQYCRKCHPDAYAGWFHSAHHFSSFNNLAYRQSIIDMRTALDREARALARAQGIAEDSDEFRRLRARKVQATRWCAGCHDPVPFFSGAFDDDGFFRDLEVDFPLDGKHQDPSIEKRPTAHAGLTCNSCHAITHINSVTGNGDYTIQEPPAYPFQYSTNPLLQAVNEYLVKAKPDLHKRSMLKPFHRTAEFCQVCHKVSLPKAVNGYKWIRGQDHYDSWHLSGVSGYGSRSFYHPPVAQKCSDCHMPLMPSRDFGNIDGMIHNHLFLGANTALPKLRLYQGERNHLPPIGDEDDVIRTHQNFLRSGKIRVDIFAVRDRGEVDGDLHVIDADPPVLQPGKTYLIEVVIRNLGVGHHFTQGTVDSNEIWLHLEALNGDERIGESGQMDRYGYVDARSHFVNALILDRKGQRIDRRNAKDIFVPLYNHQIPPSSSQVVHYRLTIPETVRGPITLRARLKYRKFDRIYQDFFMNRRRRPQAAWWFATGPWNLSAAGELFGLWAMQSVYESHRGPELPVTVMAEDEVALSTDGSPPPPHSRTRPPLWQRYNDYGVALLLQGNEGAERGLLKQAEAAFLEVTRLHPDYADGYLNLARVYLKEGRLPEAARVLEQARQVKPGYFKTAWLRGLLNRLYGRFDEAIADFQTVLQTRIPERKFDFSQDREIRRLLAQTLDQKAQLERDDSPEQHALLRQAIAEMQKVLAIDPEDLQAHYLLDKWYRQLGEIDQADKHLKRYLTYQVDNNARDDALRFFRLNHDWADNAAQAIVIYDVASPRRPSRISRRDDRSAASQPVVHSGE